MILTVPQPAEEAIDVTANDYQKATTKQTEEKQVTESINPAEPNLNMEDSEEDEDKKEEEKPEWNELR